MRSRLLIPGLPLILALSLSIFTSCDDECNCNENVAPQVPEERWINDIFFVQNTYFFLDRPPSEQYPNRFIRPKEGSIDLYRSVPAVLPAETPTTWGAAYVDSLGRGAGIGVGADFHKRLFELLTPDDDYRLVRDPVTDQAIGIELIEPISTGGGALAAAYVNEAGDTIGDYGEPGSRDENAPLLLELIWPSLPIPQGPFGYTWAYMMRNVYDLGINNIDASTLDIDIHEIANRPDTSTPDSSSVPWIRIFGLDQTDAAGSGPPDGKVDLATGVVDAERGRLIFPGITPFDPDPGDVEYWTNGEFAFTGRYEGLTNPGLYTRLPTDPAFGSKFVIHVTAVGVNAGR